MTINPLRSRPPVEISDRKAPTKAQKVAAWNRENGLCVLCGKPVAPEGLDVEWDHRNPRAISGDDTTENLFAVHVKCHARKTHGKGGDISRVAKTKRQAKMTAPKVRKRSSLNKHPTLVRGFDGQVRERSK